MRFLRQNFRPFFSALRRFKCGHYKTITLYVLNLLLALTLTIQILDERRTSPVSFEETYRNGISYAMETFDFMYRQKLAAKPIPPPEDMENLPVIQKRCRPSLRDLKDLNASVNWNNALWQSVKPSSTEIYLYSAFFDHRPNVIFPEASSSVQIIGVVWRRLKQDVYCQLWSSDTTMVSVKALSREIWQRAWDPRDRFYVPYLFTCPLPQRSTGSNAPVYVSLVVDDFCAQRQSPSTFLPIHNHEAEMGSHQPEEQQPGEKRTVVCVKGMDFLEDLSPRFVEWLELNFHVGADKVVIYTYAVHSRVRKVIEYYVKTTAGRLEHIPLTLPGRAPNAPLHRSRFIKRNRQQKRRHELVPYNDCLYRHVRTHDYVLIVDVDELIVPIRHENWNDMLNEVKRRAAPDDADATWTAFSIANAFFFDNSTTTANRLKNKDEIVPSYTHILRHDRRSRKISPPGVYGKSFMDTRNVATVFNHFPLHKQRRQLDAVLRATYYVDPNLARKNHYKAVCPIESRDECPDLYKYAVRDESATRYASYVAPKIKAALKAIGIEPQ